MKDCYIYVAKEIAGNYYKIGCSDEPEKDILTLQKGNPFEIVFVTKFAVKNGDPCKQAILDHFHDKLTETKTDWLDLEDDSIDIHINQMKNICQRIDLSFENIDCNTCGTTMIGDMYGKHMQFHDIINKFTDDDIKLFFKLKRKRDTQNKSTKRHKTV
jgi:hypothetical protein